MPDIVSSDLSVESVYKEIANNYRFFLGWRHRVFAGYVAVLAGLSVAYWSVGSDDVLQKVIVGASFVLTVVFWMLEYRTRDVYHACQNSGEVCERNLPEGVGIFTRFNSNSDVRGKRITHSLGIDLLFVLVILASVVGEVYLWLTQ